LRRQLLEISGSPGAAAALTGIVMDQRSLQLSDNDGRRLRAVLVSIDKDLACLGRAATPAQHRSSITALAQAWAGLRQLLEPGPTPSQLQ
jgi:hypothetical protein